MQIKQFMCFKQYKAISNLSGKFLKLEGQFTYLGSYISSTESDVNIQGVERYWQIIDLMEIWSLR